MNPDLTPWDKAFDKIAWYNMADTVLAETSAESAIDAESEDDCDFQVDMVNLYALRFRIFNSNPMAIARSSAHIYNQTLDATWIDPEHILRTWPVDKAGAAITVWKAAA